VLNLLISDLTFVFLRLLLLVSYSTLYFENLFFFVSRVKTTVHTKMCYRFSTYLEKHLNNFWT
jgi:hypothetical protein